MALFAAEKGAVHHITTVLPDGAIDIKVTHRQNTHMPARLQNRRLKSVDEQTYYTDDEPCDLPAGTRLDVRVQMPADSVWNVRQGEVGVELSG
ncbi:hypothetical protein [Xenorhabdus sp. PB62.4]|uniref:phage tail fiber protein n=1 Tax=Xenorhabdus sp. PB62.4 TaxID=1851573 RepID=UPI001656F2E9|nr:hypothetical protein [Xenorhabdus sp. PB62.4]MBC8952536.1 hypothetical protein [Xenorhabdus sp. PB62.4]